MPRESAASPPPNSITAAAEAAGAFAPIMPPPPNLQGKTVRANWNATALAYLGDSVWELYVRRHFFFPPSRLTRYYEGVASQVRAETQESYYELLKAGAFLSEAEAEVLAWGRNARVNVPPRFKASGSHAISYKRATAVECLVGYLYLTDAPRLHQLMLHLGISGDARDGRAAISL
ncbi:hypothetical protein WJX81_003426 [Elliptochloris bilobata]|uniref:RNase III domain-containing protein n=1 Tax=Elliptochloris bilobata TaxID=381761 RepID=A0AAW1SKN3_9CHLO